MEHAAQARVGTRYAGRYDLEAILGEGGMGAVYRARHAFTGAAVALKIMHSGVARSRNAQERFLREAKAPSAVGHPGIVQVSDAGVADDGTLYLALELLEGEDFSTAVARGAVDGALAVSIACELLTILDAAHEAGLVHRDIKPENVFLARDAEGATRVRLLDFGITRQVSENDEKLTQTGTILGTPHYMSPEQARGQAVDGRSDLHSVGGTLYFVLTGQPPFVAANYNLLIVQIMTNPAPPIRSVRGDVPADLAAVIDRALAMDPANRYDSALHMREALLACAPLSLPAAVVAPDAFGATVDSTAGTGGTPIQHPVPSPPRLGAVTQPGPAKTPPSATPELRSASGIPATMAHGVSVAAEAKAQKKNRSPLILAALAAVAVLGAGAAIFATSGVEDDAPLNTAPPAVVVPAEPVGEADAAEEVTAADIEARLENLERLEREAAERAAEEATRVEAEEAERAEARRRAAMRRAEMAAAEEAAAEAERRRCNLGCTQELARCRREGGAHGAAAAACHRAWSGCTRECAR